MVGGKIRGRVLLSHNRDVSPAAFRRADRLRRAIAQSVEARDAYIGDHGLDRRFCLPAANWGENGENDFLEAYKHVRDGRYEVINRLRFWSQVFSGYQVMSLSPGTGLRSVNPIPPDFDSWIKAQRPLPDQWIEIWTKHTRAIPYDLLYRPRRALGEIGWNIDGVVVNHDTYVYQERINILFESGLLGWLGGLNRVPRILEIGGGYGALAAAFRKILPNCSYVICDLPESLIFSGLYLTLTETVRLPKVIAPADSRLASLSGSGVVLIPNYMFHLLVEQGISFDLVINTLSMSEMSEMQVRQYSAGIAQFIGTQGVFFEQNQDNRSIGLNYCKEIIRDYFPINVPRIPKLAGMTEGRPDLWANVDLSFLKPFELTFAPQSAWAMVLRGQFRLRQWLSKRPRAPKDRAHDISR